MIGAIGFSNNKKGLLPKLIRFFTKSNLSHTFIMMEDIVEEPSLIEAIELISVMPFNKSYKTNDDMEYWIFDVKAPDEVKKQSLRKVYAEFAGTKYGFFQNIWFCYRRIMEFFGRDVRKQKNWMTDGVICSELVFYYLSGLGEEYKLMLAKWNPNTIQPADLAKIVLTHPEYFTLVDSKAAGEICLR